ncbi:hypothetical protein QBC38DRAFT_466983 [Podospora fimiseda]|uniref:Uncharacterized protein n=1 Tax=Podospora fimiseda TaxID=252190 RepID=A0AAN7BWW5_9PEZI|nr:hypothetical protein QBC38DRAFT_466983 [Podospora fimiseda]
MAARPGEDVVASLLGDIHYFYGGSENQFPPHHRFDKGSYIYLFEDANQGRARIEIANQPGTEEQDAFSGYLDNVTLEYSYNHTCRATIVVGQVQGDEDWHLPTWDPHNQAKYHYKLSSLDIYFLNQQDALLFINVVRRVLPAPQARIEDEPGPPPRHNEQVSSLVQNLERAAISEDAAAAALLPPPPPPQAPAAFVPMAYNPAAPAAPEQLKHREKTPPPDDGVTNPLHQTLAYDAQGPFSPGLAPSNVGPLSPGFAPPNFQHPPGAPSFPGPPVASPGFAPHGFGSLGGHPGGLTHHPTAHTPVATPPVASPPVASPPVSTASPQHEYAVHQQFYVPESQYKPPKESKPGKLEDKAGRMEKGVTGMLKKFEKKFG